MKNCPKKKCFLTFLAVFVFIFLFDGLVHGYLLSGLYAETASLWRPQEEMQAMWPWCVAFHLLLAGVITCFYGLFLKSSGACTTEAAPMPQPSGCKMTMCFGLKLGLIMGLLHASSYIWMPIPGTLAVAWLASGIVKGLGVGLVLGLVCKKKDCKKA